ncbi:MAG: hypothetical protein HOE75_07880 [Chloroflexi bacterium]|nr:hypothetical protein [Chloroflexota bacterium]
MGTTIDGAYTGGGSFGDFVQVLINNVDGDGTIRNDIALTATSPEHAPTLRRTSAGSDAEREVVNITNDGRAVR